MDRKLSKSLGSGVKAGGVLAALPFAGALFMQGWMAFRGEADGSLLDRLFFSNSVVLIRSFWITLVLFAIGLVGGFSLEFTRAGSKWIKYLAVTIQLVICTAAVALVISLTTMKEEGWAKGLLLALFLGCCLGYLTIFVSSWVVYGNADGFFKSISRSDKAKLNDFESLMKALRNEDADVRERAAKKLGDLGDERAVASLIPLLKDEEWLVRSAAVISLGKIGNSEVVDHLVSSLEDKDEDVRKSAVEALKCLGGQEAERALQRYSADIQTR